MKIQSPARPVAPKPAAVATPAAEVEAPAVKAGWAAKSGAVAGPAAGATQARNRATAERFFEVFGKREGPAIESFYRPDATFHDDMFDLSKRDSIMKMWAKAPPFATFKAEVLSAEGDTVKARWVVDYEMFGNKIHNEIDSTLTFDANGKISAQQEHWDPSKWMSQALPLVPRFAQGLAYMVMRPLLSRSMGG